VDDETEDEPPEDVDPTELVVVSEPDDVGLAFDAALEVAARAFATATLSRVSAARSSVAAAAFARAAFVAAAAFA
jgi:hypothetical protein